MIHRNYRIEVLRSYRIFYSFCLFNSILAFCFWFVGGFWFCINDLLCFVFLCIWEKKSVWKLWVFFFPPKPQFSITIRPIVVLAGRTKLRVSKNFFRGISFCICWISLQPQPQNQTKNIKNYSSILDIVSHLNWLDDSPPLKEEQNNCFDRMLFIDFLYNTWPICCFSRRH